MEKNSVIKSRISNKFRLTIPEIIRENLNLSVNDKIEWKVDKNRAIIYPSFLNIMSLKNKIKVGNGDINKDIEQARKIIAGSTE